MWELVKPYDAQLVSFLLTLASGAIIWLFQRRVRLTWGVTHRFIHTILNKQAQTNNHQGIQADKEKVEEEPDWTRMAVESAEYIIFNDGRKPATNLEATFNYQPASFEVWPQRAYTTEVNPNGKLIVRFEGLAPKEQFTIHMLNINEATPNLLGLRCSEVTAKGIETRPMRVWPTAFNFFIACVMVLGFFAMFFLTIQTVGWFSRLASAI